MKYEVKGIGFVNGYKILNVPDCPRGNPVGSEGWQYEHILIIEDDIGRRLSEDECVHHLDGNRGNNRKENLILMLKSSHWKLHQWADREGIEFKEYKQYPSCTICGITLQGKQVSCCSVKCLSEQKHRMTAMPDKDVLEQLIHELSFVKIGKLFGVSDNAVRKWCKKYDLPTEKSIVRPEKIMEKKSKRIKLEEKDKEWINENYIPRHKEYGARALGKLFNVAHTSILDVIKSK